MDMNNYNYRFDYLRLSTEEKPLPNVDGSTCYEVDTSEFYIAYKGQWYKQGANEENEETKNSLNRNPVNISKNLIEDQQGFMISREEPEEIIEPIEETQEMEEPLINDLEEIDELEEGEE